MELPFIGETIVKITEALKIISVFFSLQTGTIRTNCLDCLDRTNSVQTFLGLEVSCFLKSKFLITVCVVIFHSPLIT